MRTPIDAFLQATLETRGLRMTREASPRTLIRRIKKDLVGLPPTPEEAAQFEQACECRARSRLSRGEISRGSW